MKTNLNHSGSFRHIRSMRALATLAMSAAAMFGAASATAAPILSDALASFAVLGASGVTNVPVSIIGGNLGSAPNASVGGGYIFTSGSRQGNTLLAQQAQLDLDAAIVTLSSFGPGITILDGNLDAYQFMHGGSIAPGIYTVSGAEVNLSGDLVLDGGNDRSAMWIFQLPSTLITSTTSNVLVQNVGDGANVGVYWNVHSAATLNGPTFEGNVLANNLISSDGNLTISCGRLLSANSQVTLIQDRISITGCANGGFAQGAPIGSGGIGGSDGQVVPEPATLALFGFGLAAVAVSRRRRPR
ncbi:MAG TPA: ice-binding family protein [Telluria sp.]|nr:ice-binding family protein [Telluria sp.]